MKMIRRFVGYGVAEIASAFAARVGGEARTVQVDRNFRVIEVWS